jgi:hypothetical protein
LSSSTTSAAGMVPLFALGLPRHSHLAPIETA